MAFTFQEVVDGALRQLGVLAAGSSATAEETSDALDALSDWLDQESLHGLMQAERSEARHTFAASQLDYSVGAAGGRDIALDLPAELHEVLYRRSFETDARPLDQISFSALARYRDSAATVPYLFVVEKSDPAMLRFDARPVAGDQLTLVGGTWLTAERGMIQPAAQVGLQRGYKRALVLGLAMELANPYGVQVDRLLAKRADDAMERLRATNIEPFTVEFDPALLNMHPIGIR